ncbi:alpha/beta fold hydrolase BchO [Elioraea sp.]|uniref:alpha/beta fold hydrolase BchO n=1 Tax=Elioraea sp. TaxID=2185103 RepID=UPI003F70B4FD
MTRRPDWVHDGRDWPNRIASQFVPAGGIVWHVQVMGEGPAVLLLHGTGAATHSWARLLPLLARSFTVIAPDLPGHGFTESPSEDGFTLPGMAARVAALLDALGHRPGFTVGHSAGAAVLARMALDGLLVPRSIVSLNGALVPIRNGPGDVPWFSGLARFMVTLPVVPWVLSWQAADRATVERLLAGTGSTIPPEQVALYTRLLRKPSHVAAALAMMAAWDLRTLAGDLPRLAVPLILVVGSNDRTVPPGDAERVRALVPAARIVSLPGLGHLAHEERPDLAAALIEEAALAPADR